ncbi:16S rRNA methyltransferase, partial [Xanthomonas sp. Kuri4-2]
MAVLQDAPLHTLFLPFAQAALRWPAGPVLFLRARDGWPL